MSKPSARTVRYLLAATCFLMAIPVYLQGFALAFTAGDGMSESPQACNAACQEGWHEMAKHGGNWIFGSYVLILSSLVLAILARWPQILRWRPFGASR